MAKYSANNGLAGAEQAIASTYKTLLALTAQTSGLKRAWVNHWTFGTDGTPADQAMNYDISKQTAVGTSTAVTPNPDDDADPACATVGSANFTAEGTITAASSKYYAGVNARATVQWWANQGQEIVIPATNLAGFAFRAKSPGYTGTATCFAKFFE